MQNAAIWIFLLLRIMANLPFLSEKEKPATTSDDDGDELWKKKERNIYYCLLNKKYDFSIKLHKPFCTKASLNACMIHVSIHFVIKSAR